MFKKLKDKYVLIFFLIILILGVFIRFHNFGQEGLWNDDMTGIPTGLLWFYPSNFYPGLAGQGEPALGNFFIGLGCIMSGEDFSRVSEVGQMFFPGREILIGEALTNGEIYCHLPMYFFGLLFFITIIILAFSLLNKKSALYFTAFFAFWPFLLEYSRWIHVEIILYFFVALGILFLWWAYKQKKQSKKELLFFAISFASFGLAFGTKFPAALYLIFAVFMILEKYKKEALHILSKIFQLKTAEKETKIAPLIITAITSAISFIFFWLLAFKFSLKNFFDVLARYQTAGGPEYAQLFNIHFFQSIYRILVRINVIDLLLFVFAFYVLIRLILKKGKSKNEKFILYLAIFFWLAAISATSMLLARVLITFIPGLILLMSLAFSDKEYSLFSLFKIKNKKAIFAIFLIIYIILSFSIAVKDSPYFSLRNKILCFNQEGVCKPEYSIYQTKPTADYLKTILNENETFMLQEGIIFYYLNREQGILDWQFGQAFQKQFGRSPTLTEKIKYFKPNDKTVRYLIVEVLIPENNDYPEDVAKITQSYKPNQVIEINNVEVVWIYDLLNMQPR